MHKEWSRNQEFMLEPKKRIGKLKRNAKYTSSERKIAYLIHDVNIMIRRSIDNYKVSENCEKKKKELRIKGLFMLRNEYIASLNGKYCQKNRMREEFQEVLSHGKNKSCRT